MFKNKKIVICQSALHFLSGSEIVTLELATYLRDHGAKVLVFTWFLSDPIKHEFESRQIEVITDDNDRRLLGADFVWVHHQAIPKIVLENIKTSKTKFLFFHMSATETIYLEQPYVYGLEEKLGSKSLFVSDEALEFITSKYPGLKKQASVLKNWAPENFCDFKFNQTDNIRSVLAVSNHTPEEVSRLRDVLAAKGITVDYVGNNGERTLVTPERLARTSVVVTIGKTVQYCLCMGLPVYVYDHFGGPGYLTEKNYNKARKLNFSGRGFKSKTTETIADELVSQFNNAKVYQEKNRARFIEEFGIGPALEKVFGKVAERDFSKLDDEFLASSIGTLWLVRERCIADNCLVKSLEENRKVHEELEKYSSAYNSLKNSRTVRLVEKVKGLGKKKEVNPFSLDNGYSLEVIKPASEARDMKIIGMIREKNESLILEDTLTELEKIVDGFVLLDDNSDDNSVEIARRHAKCLTIIRHNITVEGDRSMEESIHRQLLLDEAKKYNPEWLYYQDADERVEGGDEFRKYMLAKAKDKTVSSIRLSLYDAYMTLGDEEPYTSGKLYGFRKMFGQERRDILMAWKNCDSATFKTRADMREPDGIDTSRTVTKFYVQHYGKAISEEQWEETCDYYVEHFPGYAEKWRARKGKAIHSNKSDFDTDLMTWGDVKKSGGILIG